VGRADIADDPCEIGYLNPGGVRAGKVMVSWLVDPSRALLMAHGWPCMEAGGLANWFTPMDSIST